MVAASHPAGRLARPLAGISEEMSCARVDKLLATGVVACVLLAATCYSIAELHWFHGAMAGMAGAYAREIDLQGAPWAEAEAQRTGLAALHDSQHLVREGHAFVLLAIIGTIVAALRTYRDWRSWHWLAFAASGPLLPGVMVCRRAAALRHRKLPHLDPGWLRCCSRLPHRSETAAFKGARTDRRLVRPDDQCFGRRHLRRRVTGHEVVARPRRQNHSGTANPGGFEPAREV